MPSLLQRISVRCIFFKSCRFSENSGVIKQHTEDTRKFFFMWDIVELCHRVLGRPKYQGTQKLNGLLENEYIVVQMQHSAPEISKQLFSGMEKS